VHAQPSAHMFAAPQPQGAGDAGSVLLNLKRVQVVDLTLEHIESLMHLPSTAVGNVPSAAPQALALACHSSPSSALTALGALLIVANVPLQFWQGGFMSGDALQRLRKGLAQSRNSRPARRAGVPQTLFSPYWTGQLYAAVRWLPPPLFLPIMRAAVCGLQRAPEVCKLIEEEEAGRRSIVKALVHPLTGNALRAVSLVPTMVRFLHHWILSNENDSFCLEAIDISRQLLIALSAPEAATGAVHSAAAAHLEAALVDSGLFLPWGCLEGFGGAAELVSHSKQQRRAHERRCAKAARIVVPYMHVGDRSEDDVRQGWLLGAQWFARARMAIWHGFAAFLVDMRLANVEESIALVLESLEMYRSVDVGCDGAVVGQQDLLGAVCFPIY
jgi:hypothetical protein